MFILFIADCVYACTYTYALIHVCITILLIQFIQKMERKGGEVHGSAGSSSSETGDSTDSVFSVEEEVYTLPRVD